MRPTSVVKPVFFSSQKYRFFWLHLIFIKKFKLPCNILEVGIVYRVEHKNPREDEKMRLLIKTYPDCPKASAVNAVSNVVWGVLFLFLFYYNIIPQTGTPMVLGLLAWALGSFVICFITDKIKENEGN